MLLTATEMVHPLQNGPSAASLEQMKPALIDACKRPTQGQQSSQREPNPLRRQMLLCSYLLQVEALSSGQEGVRLMAQEMLEIHKALHRF